jgi:hypothetical protein
MTGTNPRIINFLIAAMIIVSIAAFQLWPYFDCFYKGIAVTFLISGVLLLYCFRNLISVVWFLLALNNAADEFFFDPKTFGLNEKIFCLFLILYIIFSLINNGRKKRTA